MGNEQSNTEIKEGGAQKKGNISRTSSASTGRQHMLDMSE